MKKVFLMRSHAARAYAARHHRTGGGGQSPLPSVRALGVVAAVLLLTPALALADTLVLKSAPTDGDGRITIGDVFDNAGAQANVIIGYRTGATAVLDAGTVQMVASRNGATWDNPRGQRRIIVASGADGSAPDDTQAAPVASVQKTSLNKEVLVYAHSMNAGDIVQPEDLQFASVQAQAATGGLPRDARSAIGKVVRFPTREGGVVHTGDLTSPTVIKRAEAVKVTWASNGMALSMTGIASKDGAIGDLIQIQNPTSKKMVDAIVTGPGEALTGPAADELRTRQTLSLR